MPKYRITTNGKLFNYQEQLPNGDWWTAAYPTTEEIVRSAVEKERERTKDEADYYPIS